MASEIHDWSSWEVSEPPPTVSEALGAGPGDRPGKMIRAMRLMELNGFPPPVGRLDFQVAGLGPPKILILKAKPTCWRVFFAVDHSACRIIYLSAVCTKKQKRSSDDVKKASNRAQSFQEDGNTLRRFRSPLS